MKKEDLFRAINEIDDDLLLQSEKKVSRFRTKNVGMGIALTALACCLLVVGLNIPQKTSQNSPNDPLNPIPPAQVDLSIPDYPDYVNPFIAPIAPPNYHEGQLAYNPNLPKLDVVFHSKTGGMGFEGYSIKAITDLLSNNTWNESVIYKELPVYKNQIDLSIETLTHLLMETAKQLNMNIIENQIKLENEDWFGDEHYVDLSIEDENYSINISGTNKTQISTLIRFKKPIQLPKQLNNNYYATLDEKNDVGNYYKEKIASTFELQNPMMRITGGDFNIYGQQSYEISYVEGDSQIFDAMSKTVVLHGSEEGKTIDLLKIVYEDNYEKIADYPIISVGKAKALLLDGKYYASAPKPILTEDNILKVEMDYCSNGKTDVVIPFYRFYMKTEQQIENEFGLMTVGAYYVPAIEAQYLENQEYWKAEFQY